LKKTMFVVLALVIVGIIIAVVAFRCNAKPANYTEGDAKETIETKAGNQFTITLRGNVTTGYIWQMAKGTESAIVKKVSDKYIAENTERTGAGGDHVWTFEALKAGDTTITLEYLRPWEKPKDPANSVKFKVKVE